MVGGEVLRPLPCAHDLEPACSRPVDELAHERRLVAVGEAVDDSGRPGALGQGRPHECIGLHRHHHDVGAAAYCRQRVLDPRDGGARGLDDHVGVRCPDQVDRIVGDGDGSRPLGEIERAAGAIRRAVGHARQVDAAKVSQLGEEHRSEGSGADQDDPERPPGRRAIRQPLVERAPHGESRRHVVRPSRV